MMNISASYVEGMILLDVGDRVIKATPEVALMTVKELEDYDSPLAQEIRASLLEVLISIPHAKW